MPDTDLEIRRGGGFRSSRPLDSGEGGAGLQKKFFSALRVSVWAKNNGWPGPLNPSLNKTQGWTMHPLSSRAVHSLARSLNKLGGSARKVRWTIRKLCEWGWLKYKINIHARGKYMYHNSFHRSISTQ